MAANSAAAAAAATVILVQLQLLFQFLFTTIGIVVLTILEIFQQLALSIFLFSEMPFRKTCQLSANVNYLMVSHTVVPERQGYCMTLSTTAMIDLTSGVSAMNITGPQEISGSRICAGCHGQGFSD
jgi:hypothetical protein